MKILNLDTGQLFSSITAAARAVGVDPSNVGKVIRGQRNAAGGYRFASVPEGTTSGEIKEAQKRILKAIDAATPERQRERQARQRQKAETIYQAQLRGTHEAVKYANEIIKTYKREKVYSLSDRLSDLVELGDYIGLTSAGYLRESQKNLRELFPTAEELPDLAQLHNRLVELTRAAEEDLELAKQRKRDLADQLGISNAEMSEYMPVMHEFFDILDIAGKDKAVGSKTIYREVTDAMEAGVSRGDIRKLFRKVKRWFKNPKKKIEKLDSILTKWVKETMEEEGEDSFKA